MSKFSIEQRCEIMRTARENVRRRDDAAANRAGAPNVVYKTRDDALVADEAPVAVAASVQFDTSTWSGWVEQRLEERLAIADEAVGTAIGEREADLRAHFSQENKALKRALERQAKQLRDLRENAAATRERLEQEDAVTRYEIGLVRRELAMLREELGLERGLKTLHEEIATARAEIPKVSAIEARIDAEQSRLEAEQERLGRELAKTKERLSKLRVNQSIADYKISGLGKQIAAPKAPVVALEVETSVSRFVLRDIHPDAAQALRDFAAQVIDARDGAPIWLSPAGSA